MVQGVRLVRIARGLKAYELAAILGYNPQYWYQVEKGIREPPVEIANKAEEVLNVPKDELFRPAEALLGGRDG